MLCSTIFKMYAILVFASMVVSTRTYSEEYVKGSYENWVPIPNDLYFTTLAFNDYPQYSTETTNNKNLWTPVNNDYISGAIDTENVIQIVKHVLINKTDEKAPQPAEVYLLQDEQNAEPHTSNTPIQHLKNISSVNNSSILINNTNELGHFVMKLRNMRRLRPSRKPKDIQYKHTNINNYGSTISPNDREESLIKQNKIKTDINPRHEENTRIRVEETHDNKASSTQSVGVKHNNRFINNLNNILSAYNIYNDDIGRNYRISRQYEKEIPKKVNAEHYIDGTVTQIPIPHQQRLIYNNWNDLPVDPLFAVLLSRYGVRLNVGSKKLGYLAPTYTIPN